MTHLKGGNFMLPEYAILKGFSQEYNLPPRPVDSMQEDLPKVELTPTEQFINKINDYINSFNLDALLTKDNDIFLNFDNAKIQDYITGTSNFIKFTNETYNTAESFTNTSVDVAKAAARKPTDNDDFIQKKNFYDEVTKFINSKKIFNDTPENQKNIFKYQYLINTFFNHYIAMYRDKYSLSDDKIVFIYKGGTYMKIMYTKYKDYLSANINDKLKDIMGRSDSDYAILINKNLGKKQYTEHYYRMNILIYNIMNKIQTFIVDNLSELVDLDSITNSDMLELINTMNKTLSDKRANLPYFDEIEKFVGISIGSNTFYRETIPNKFTFHKLKLENKVELLYAKPQKFIKSKKIDVKRSNFMVTLVKDSDKEYRKLISNKKTVANDVGVYNYYNETNYFTNDGKLTYFCLHRMKLNTVLYYKTKKNEYGYFLCPAELIDIPIANFTDVKTNINISQNIKKYSYTLLSKELIFNSYTMYGIIEDLIKNMTIDYYFPWDDKKYVKRINRLVFFYIIYMNLNYKNFDNINRNLINILNNNPLFNNRFITYDDQIKKSDIVFTKLQDFIKTVISRSTGLPTTTDKDNFIGEILSTVSLASQLTIDNDYNNPIEAIEFLEKYRKYKNKYLQLKNKINKF